MNGIPRLETERLILRAHRLEDFEAYAEFWAMPEVVRFITGVPMTREGAWGRMLRVNGMWHLMGFGFLAIEERRRAGFWARQASRTCGAASSLPSKARWKRAGRSSLPSTARDMRRKRWGR